MRDLARRCLKAIRSARWGSSGSIDLKSIEYVNPRSAGDPFDDAEEVARILELTRKSDFSRPVGPQ